MLLISIEVFNQASNSSNQVSWNLALIAVLPLLTRKNWSSTL